MGRDASFSAVCLNLVAAEKNIGNFGLAPLNALIQEVSLPTRNKGTQEAKRSTDYRGIHLEQDLEPARC